MHTAALELVMPGHDALLVIWTVPCRRAAARSDSGSSPRERAPARDPSRDGQEMLRALQGSQHSLSSHAQGQASGLSVSIPASTHSSVGQPGAINRSPSASSFGSATDTISSAPMSGQLRFNDENQPPAAAGQNAQHCPDSTGMQACSPAAAELLSSYSSLSAPHVQPHEASRLGRALPRKPTAAPVRLPKQQLSDHREAIGAVWRRQLSNPMFAQSEGAEAELATSTDQTGLPAQPPLRSNLAFEAFPDAPPPATAPPQGPPSAVHSNPLPPTRPRHPRLPARQHENPAFEPHPRRTVCYPDVAPDSNMCQLSSAYSSALASAFPELHSNPAFETADASPHALEDSTAALEPVSLASPPAKPAPEAAAIHDTSFDSTEGSCAAPDSPNPAPTPASRCPCPPSSPTSQSQQQAAEAGSRTPLKELQLSMYGSPQVSARRHSKSKSALSTWLLNTDPGTMAGSVSSPEWHSILSTDPTGLSLESASSGVPALARRQCVVPACAASAASCVLCCPCAGHGSEPSSC